MNRQTSIALHLARVMGKEIVQQFNDGRIILAGGYEWSPYGSLSQWADCVLWAWLNNILVRPDSQKILTATWYTKTLGWGYWENEHGNTQSSIQDAALEAIARATGWEESK